MISAQPMPNELAEAHAQRLGFINGCASRIDLDELLAKEVRLRGRDPKEMLRIGQLALVSGIGQAEYVNQHTMLGVLRVAAKAGEGMLHGDPAGDSLTQMNGFRTQRPGSFVCLKCVEEDLKHWHFTWYRRTHHLAGVDWCWSHGIALHQVRSNRPFDTFPHECVREGNIEQVKACVETLPNSGYVARYVELACNLLLRQRPCDATEINETINKRAQQLGLRLSRNGSRPLLSDLMRSHIPTLWLHAHVPGWSKKNESEFLRFLDLPAISRTKAHVGASYVAVLAALFETAEDALQQIQTATPSTATIKLRPPKYREQPEESRFWTGQFWKIYARHQGNAQTIAQELQMHPNRVLIKMKKIGLPSAHCLESDPKWRVLTRFNKGEDLLEACAVEEADVADVQVLLRTVSRPVGELISRFLVQREAAHQPTKAQVCKRVETTKGKFQA